MRNIFLCLYLLFCFSISGQSIHQIEVKYEVHIFKNEESEFEKMISGFGDIYEAAKEVDFTLLCNDQESLFFENEKKYSSNSLVSFSLIHTGYLGRVKQKNNINYVENERNHKAIVTHNNHNWQLVNEQKTIDNYVCYKAVATYTYHNESIDKTFHFPAEVWYAPELNFPFGPNGQGGLPGLILEYKIKNVVYGATEVKFHKEKMEIPALNNYPHYTFEEFDRMIGEMNKHRLNNNQ